MKRRDSKDVTRAEGVPAPSRAFYVIECDAFELPEFHEREAEFCTNERNKRHMRTIDNGEGHDRKWFGSEIKHDSGPELWADAKRLLQEGWQAGANEARKLSDKLVASLPEPECARRKPIWKDEGDELDRDRLYSGDLDTAWRGTTKVVQRAPRVIKIAANWSMNAGYSASQIKWNGIAFCALLDTLERAGYGTELVLGFPLSHYGSSDNPGFQSMPVVRVKSAGEPLDLSNMAVVAGNAGVYRSFGFAMVCSAPYDVGYGLGSCTLIETAWTEAVAAGVVEPVDAFMETSWSEADALERCRAVLKNLFPEMTWPEEGAK